MNTTVVHTGSAGTTQAVAARLATLVGPGDLIVLCGALGAGKTTFTQWFGEALGGASPVTSPPVARAATPWRAPAQRRPVRDRRTSSTSPPEAAGADPPRSFGKQ